MWGYPEYVPVAKKRENAQKALKKLRKQEPRMSRGEMMFFEKRVKK